MAPPARHRQEGGLAAFSAARGPENRRARGRAGLTVPGQDGAADGAPDGADGVGVGTGMEDVAAGPVVRNGDEVGLGVGFGVGRAVGAAVARAVGRGVARATGTTVADAAGARGENSGAVAARVSDG